MADERREFCEVVDWDAYQYTDTRKVPSPPWRWFRVQMTLLRSPEWLELTKPLRADFIALLGAASETGNLIPMDRRWLSSKQISRSSIEKLTKIDLCRVFFLPSNDKRIKALRRAYSGASPPPEAEAETEAETEGDRSTSQHGGSTTAGASDRDDRAGDLNNSIPSPAPSRGWRTGRCQSAGDVVGKKNGRDRRPFDEIKLSVLQAARKLDTADPDQIHKLAGQSLRASAKQVTVAVNQLKEDGEL